MKKRLWHPFAFLLAGLVMVGGLWFGAGYCTGYGEDHPKPAAIAAGMVGLSVMLGIGGLVAGVLSIGAIIETFPDEKSPREETP